MCDLNRKVIGTKLVWDGFVYLKSKDKPHLGRTYWDCNRLRSKECKARAVTSIVESGQTPLLFKGPSESPHSHVCNFEECQAEIVKYNVVTAAEVNPTQLPGQIIKDAIANLEPRVLSHLPDQENLKKSIRRKRRKNLPLNPHSLANLDDYLPDDFKVTLLGEQFLIYDSKETDDKVDGRVIVFSTRRNLEILSQSHTWFLDGSFRVAPSIFTQVFTVLGTIATEKDTLSFPFVYALLSSKETPQYAIVLNAIKTAAQEYGIPQIQPQQLMLDFEEAILNACSEVYPTTPTSCCFFHLGQSVYSKVQAKGLHAAYNDAADSTIRTWVHMMLALAFVPGIEVRRVFGLFKRAAPAALTPVVDYFDETYVNGISARGRRLAVPPRYVPDIWNQYTATINNEHRTNNVTEGWHNRFKLVVEKNRTDTYTLIKEFKKEQADTEESITKFSLCKRVKATPKKKWNEFQKRLRERVLQYHSYNGVNELEYLRELSYIINL